MSELIRITIAVLCILEEWTVSYVCYMKYVLLIVATPGGLRRPLVSSVECEGLLLKLVPQAKDRGSIAFDWSQLYVV